MKRHFVAVAAADHVRRGRTQGFMQVCHGKAAPLRRLQPGDRVVYYSPTVTFGGADRLQAFTAIGTVSGAPYQVEMGRGFRPFRRDVIWDEAREVTIKHLLDDLEFTASRRNWGYQLRFGLFEISEADMTTIARAMRSLGRAEGRAKHGKAVAKSLDPC